MWEQYLDIAINTTQEFWPLLGTVMLVLVIPLMIYRVGRHGHLAAKSVNELYFKIDELQQALKKVKHGDAVADEAKKAVDGPMEETSAEEDLKQQEAEKVFEAFAKACQEKSLSQEAQAEVQEEKMAQGFSFDGNLAVDQPEFNDPVKGTVTTSAPEPEVESKPALASTPSKPAAAQKDRNVVQCSQCGNKLAYKGEWSGKKVKCPSCKEVLPLP